MTKKQEINADRSSQIEDSKIENVKIFSEMTKKDIEKSGYKNSPLTDNSLDQFNVIEAPITKLTRESLKNTSLSSKSISQSKNMFALGIVYWMFNRPMTTTENFIKKKFSKNSEISKGNIKVLHDGYNFANTIEAFSSSYTVKSAKLKKGRYRNIKGNQAMAWGFIAASEKSGKDLFLGSYPITPASDILHELAKYKNLGVKTFQAEDEISGICSAIGASFAGNLGITTTSGPGFALKGEALGLAIMTELPLVVVDVQRGGPSTGLPTKTEQSDLMQALYGRNGESPAVVIACSTPSNCFDWSYIASKITLEYNTPVVLLSDGYLGNGSEPWRIKTLKDMQNITPLIAKEGENYEPYLRDNETLARKLSIPGTKGLEHRIGGLEKEDITGNVSYDPENHEKMCKIRSEKIKKIAEIIELQEVYGEKNGDLLVIGWGGTFGSLYTSVNKLITEGKSIAFTHFNYIHPLPKNTLGLISKYKKIVVCELNSGQFANYLRMNFQGIIFDQYNKLQGLPFTTLELESHFRTLLD